MAKATDNTTTRETGRQLDSTAKLPMVDLGTAIEVVTTIRDKAVETASMPEVAKALGYANATSTPFYRRITAARLFGLLESNGSALTEGAMDYLKPDDELMKSLVLLDAVTGIPYYAELVNKYSGKKLNAELVANAIAKENNLTDACASICAKAFEASLRFSGMLMPDGTVKAAQHPSEPPLPPPPPNDGEKDEKPKSEVVTLKQGTQKHSLYLDKDKAREFSFTGPVEISQAEYDRICKWLQFTMIISEPKEPT